MNTQNDEQTRLLKEILKWIKFAGMKEVKGTLSSVIDSDQKKVVYQLSDGTRGTVEIAKLAGIGSNRTVADMWQIWLKFGLGESIPVKGGMRFKRSFDLTDFGIEVPLIKAGVEKPEPPQVAEQQEPGSESASGKTQQPDGGI